MDIVRCEHCIYYNKNHRMGYCKMHDMDHRKPDWYCADGMTEKPQPMKPKTRTRHSTTSSVEYRCPKCLQYLYRKGTSECPNCRQPIRWA